MRSFVPAVFRHRQIHTHELTGIMGDLGSAVVFSSRQRLPKELDLIGQSNKYCLANYFHCD